MVRAVFLLMVALMQITVGKELTWFPNSNWETARNWKLGRLPNEKEIANFRGVPLNAVIYLNTAVAVRGIVLPVDGKVVLGPNAAISLSEGSRDAVLNQTNDFTGARDNLWECSENWFTADGSVSGTAPCTEDTAIFPANASFSFVTSNGTISVGTLVVRGSFIKALLPSEAEFRLNLTIKPDCVKQSERCLCRSVKCNGEPLPQVGALPVRTNWMMGTIVGSVVGILVLLLALILIVIIVAIIWHRRTRFGSYRREELTGDKSGSNVFDNPTYTPVEPRHSAHDGGVDSSTYDASSFVGSDKV